MQRTDQTARQIYESIRANPERARFGFGSRPALINIDLQQAYTRTDLYKTAYETDPDQIAHINRLADLFRTRRWPVIWTHVAYMDSGEDAGIWQFDHRCNIDKSSDIIYCKKMPSPFHETPLQSLLVWHRTDTIVITGGSTSGCVRAAAVDGLSRGYRCIVPEECVADKHESYHFANLTDLSLKYADVLPVTEIITTLKAIASPQEVDANE
jgi:nicotinamidase-related amidase